MSAFHLNKQTLQVAVYAYKKRLIESNMLYTNSMSINPKIINSDKSINSDDFRATLGRFASGVTVVTARERNGTVHGMTASAFVSVSMYPPLALVSVGHYAHMHTVLNELAQQDNAQFGISILAADQAELSNHFAGRPGPEESVPWKEQAGFPVLDGTVVSIVCELHQAVTAGDHTLYIGHIISTEYTDREPLLYLQGKYGHFKLQE